MKPREDFQGPALFSYGFRPFFLAATLFGLGIIPLWWLVWRGDVTLKSPFAPVDWHIHEMIFGYGSAVVAGFLFTAVPNWTGRLPTRGWPLASLLAFWVAGRLAVAGVFGLGAVSVALLDQMFLLAVAAMIAREIIAGKNWRNLKVLLPVGVFWLSNLMFHFEAMAEGVAETGRGLGIAVLIFLIMLIGGRIIPSFTRNWLARHAGAALPVAFNRFDALSLFIGAAALIIWVFRPLSPICAGAAAVAAVLHLLRLWRWRGAATVGSPLLLMLHLAYLAIPLGFVAVCAAAMGFASSALAAHLFGIGAIGGMTVAVMMRATMGHTGRDLVAGPVLTLAFGLIVIATVLRSAATGPLAGGAWFGLDALTLAAIAWSGAFAILSLRLAPWLMRPKAARKAPSHPTPAR